MSDVGLGLELRHDDIVLPYLGETLYVNCLTYPLLSFFFGLKSDITGESEADTVHKCVLSLFILCEWGK